MQKIRTILITVTSLTLFVGGIILLLSPIPFWSYFLGIPCILIGISFIILTFEKLSDDTIEKELANYENSRKAEKEDEEEN